MTQATIDAELKEIIRGIRLVVFDFDGVFTDNFVYVHEDGTETLRFWRSDGLGLRKLETMGIQTVVISTETNPLVSSRCLKLKLPCVQGVSDKRAVLEKIFTEKKIDLRQTAYVGNDINDLDCLRMVGLPIVVEDAHPDVLSAARLRTVKKGGYGAVREVCDLFERVRGSV